MDNFLTWITFITLLGYSYAQVECIGIDPYVRQNCGFGGIGPTACRGLGCCYSSAVDNVPWCFHPNASQSIANPNQVNLPQVNPPQVNLPQIAVNTAKSKTQTECGSVIPTERINCGFGGITKSQCTAKDCCYDSKIDNVPWCFYKTADQERSAETPDLLPENSIFPQVPLPYLPTTANIQYSGACLFHCSSTLPSDRLPCSVSGGSEQACLNDGCCYDRNAIDKSTQCYFPTEIDRPCPRRECQMPNGVSIPCICGSKDCCSAERNGQRFCYRYQDPPRPQNPISSNTIVTNPPATTTTTTTPRAMSFIEMLRKRNGGTLKGYTIYEILTQPLAKLITKARGDSSGNSTPPTTRPTTTATTTTTVATTTRITTPYTTPPPPPMRRVCSWGRCRLVPEPTQPQVQCFPTDCGKPKHYPGSTIEPPTNNRRKIVGGSRAHPFSHPWMAMILKTEGEREFLCGAAIICQHWLVTAAHCVNRQTRRSKTPDLDAVFYKIYVGRYVGQKQKHGKQVQVFNGRQDIDYIEQHEDFVVGENRGVITNDVALIRLRRPIQFDNYVQPVCLPSKGPEINKVLWATGWGITKERGPDETMLKQLGVKILNSTACDRDVPNFRETNPRGILCAGGERFQDTCTGDSGGPLVGAVQTGYSRAERRPIQQWQLYGLTSLGSPSCNTLLFDRQPALYTDITYFVPWIKARTRNCCR